MKYRKTLALGTCRVAAPCELLSKKGDRFIVKLPHHLHYPAQMLQVLRYYNEGELFDSKYNYLISQESFHKTMKNRDYLKDLKEEIFSYKGHIKDFDQYIIELSALNELLLSNGMYIEYFARKDLNSYKYELQDLNESNEINLINPDDIENRPISEDEFIYMMYQIWIYLGRKPILWISHFNAEAPDRVRLVRKECIDWVRRGALKTSGYFLDPTQIVKQLGQKVALKDNGQDIAHFTDAAVDLLANTYENWLDSLELPFIERVL